MEEHKRYNEPKKIGDIINDMGCIKNKEHEKKQLINIAFMKLACQDHADALIKTLTTYIRVDEQFEIDAKKASALITEMETFYDHESALFLRDKQRIHEQKINKKYINDHTYATQEILEKFEEIIDWLYQDLRFIVSEFPDIEDRAVYDKKINDFCLLYRKIYDDICDINCEYQELLKMI